MLVVLLVLLAISNILANRVLPAWSYVPWNLALAAAVVALGLLVRRPETLGLVRWGAGARWGAAVAAAIVAVLLLAVMLGPTRELFDDRRVDQRWALLAYHVLVRIPLGTVLLEELAFRAVLPALLSHDCQKESARTGRFLLTEPGVVVTASVLFGLWHVLPAWHLGDVNPVLADVFGDDAVARLGTVALGVAGTFAAGVGLCLLRYWSGSVLAPIIAHLSTNSVAYALAWWLAA